MSLLPHQQLTWPTPEGDCLRNRGDLGAPSSSCQHPASSTELVPEYPESSEGPVAHPAWINISAGICRPGCVTCYWCSPEGWQSRAAFSLHRVMGALGKGQTWYELFCSPRVEYGTSGVPPFPSLLGMENLRSSGLLGTTWCWAVPHCSCFELCQLGL